MFPQIGIAMGAFTNLQLSRFMVEVELQTAFTYYAYRQIYVWMDKWNETEGSGEFERMFFYVHAMLSHTANISKLLWPIPSGADYKERGIVLRALLTVPDDSPLRDRIVRNHFEHYDERLQEFIRTGGESGLIDLVLASPETILSPGPTYHRYFAPWQMRIYYRDDVTELIQVAEVIRNLRVAVRQWMFATHSWYPDDPVAPYNQEGWINGRY